MDLHRALRMTGTVLYCAAVGVLAYTLAFLLANSLTGTVARIVPPLASGLLAIGAGLTAEKVLPWLRNSRHTRSVSTATSPLPRHSSPTDSRESRNS